MKLKEQILFFKRLCFMIEAGMTLEGSLKLFSDQASKKHSAFYAFIYNAVSEGKYLHQALLSQQRSCSAFTIALIQIGEESGTLNENLKFITHQLEKQRLLKTKLLSALLYPCIIALATLSLTVFLLLIIFPKIKPLLISFNIPLPITTRLLLFTTDFLSKYGIRLGILIIALVIAGYFLITKNEKVKSSTHRLIFTIPIVSPLITRFEIASLLQKIGLLTRNGITTPQAFEKCIGTTSNRYLKNILLKIADDTEHGKTLGQSCSAFTFLFPPTIIHLISVGEKTGNLSEILLYIADMFTQEIDDLLKTMTNALEPLLMIIMGFSVGFIALSIITPIYSITQHVHH